MKLHHTSFAFATLLTCLFITGGAALQAQDMYSTVLAGNGEIYRVEAVRYGDAFPEGSEAAADDTVLVFESRKPGEPAQREIVPGTESSHQEKSPHLLLNAETDTLYMVWESRINWLHSSLHLISRNADGWSETIEVYGNPYLFKGNLQLAVTRDSFLSEEDGNEVSHQRVVLHLIWTEQISEVEDQVLYSPVILLDGEYVGSSPVYSLSEIVAPALRELPANTAAANIAPTIQEGGNADSVVIGFLEPTKRRVVSLEVAVLSGELSFIGDAVRAQLIETGTRVSLTELADRARAQLIETGHRFNPRFVQSLADDLHQLILEQNPQTTNIEALADLARAQLIETGVRFRQGLTPLQDTARAQLIEIGHRFETPRARHDLQMLLVRQFSLPDNPNGQPIDLFLSDRGKEMLAVWETGSEEQKVWYQETGDGSWSLPQALHLSPEFNRAQAYKLLEERIHSR